MKWNFVHLVNIDNWWYLSTELPDRIHHSLHCQGHSWKSGLSLRQLTEPNTNEGCQTRAAEQKDIRYPSPYNTGQSWVRGEEICRILSKSFFIIWWRWRCTKVYLSTVVQSLLVRLTKCLLLHMIITTFVHHNVIVCVLCVCMLYSASFI